MISPLFDYEKSMTEIEQLRSRLEAPENREAPYLRSTNP
jgi:hypothetical protein